MSPVTDSELSNKFLYFAFGSNLLAERIHLNNPTAKKISIGKLKNYRLDFNQHSERWKGAIATIVEDENNFVYGVLWSINTEDLKNLDHQEGVHCGLYRPVEVLVETLNGDMVRARSYQLINMVEQDKRPSYVYLSVILRGAKENNLPEDYILKLKNIKHNGYDGEVAVKISRSSSSIFCDKSL